MFKTWYAVAGGCLATLASVVAVSGAWGFYPIGLLVLLGCAVVGLLVAIGQRRDPHPQAAARDKQLVAEIREALPRRTITWLRDWDFAASWRWQQVEPVWEVAGLDDEERVPHNKRVRAARRRLLDAVHAFAGAEAQHGFPSQGANMDLRNIGWSVGEAELLALRGGDEYNLWKMRQTLLNDASFDVAEAYDAFIQVARDEHLLD